MDLENPFDDQDGTEPPPVNSYDPFYEYSLRRGDALRIPGPKGHIFLQKVQPHSS
jgi:hypothetical protein